MRILACGDQAVLVELADGQARRSYYAAVHAAVRADRLPEVVDVVPADRTVLVTVRSPHELAQVVARLRDLTPEPGAGGDPAGDTVQVPVRYDGADLDDVARQLGCSPGEVIQRHTAHDWQVEFLGFTPGFGYLSSATGGWDVARRADPRTRIPTGAVALAGPYTGVYPQPSPGGWQLIGTTTLRLWDPAREPPALFTPGLRVRFVELA